MVRLFQGKIMPHHRLYRVSLQFWENDVLQVLDNFFNEKEEAMEYAQNSYHVDEVKVYNLEGECFHHHKNERKEHDHDGYR
jgi:hypothetical protein